MPVRIDLEHLFLRESFFFESQAEAASKHTNLTQDLYFQDCQNLFAVSSHQPESYTLEFASQATSSTTASDHRNSADRNSDCNPVLYAESFDAEDHGHPCFVPFLDPLDWDDVADADRRIFVASELVELLGKHGGRYLLSKVGSVLTDETRLALREMRIRLLTFLKEKPQKKYFRIEGAGGGQELILRDLRDPATCEEGQSLDDVRAELLEILAPCRRRNALLLRSLGSSLSHSSKATLKLNGLSLSQFLALDKSFVLRKSHVYLAEPNVVHAT
jgi:hypothetical protein